MVFEFASIFVCCDDLLLSRVPDLLPWRYAVHPHQVPLAPTEPEHAQQRLLLLLDV